MLCLHMVDQQGLASEHLLTLVTLVLTDLLQWLIGVHPLKMSPEDSGNRSDNMIEGYLRACLLGEM